MPKLPTKREAIAELTNRFNQNGYVRRQNPERLHEIRAQTYKKGFEIRLVAHSEKELVHIRMLLLVLGFRIAKPFAKANHFRQPVYGREQVERFLALVGHPGA